MSSVKAAVVGAGHLGKFHAEKLFKIAQCDLVGICDTQEDKAKELAEKFYAEVAEKEPVLHEALSK